jgi:hypothetical protein
MHKITTLCSGKMTAFCSVKDSRLRQIYDTSDLSDLTAQLKQLANAGSQEKEKRARLS